MHPSHYATTTFSLLIFIYKVLVKNLIYLFHSKWYSGLVEAELSFVHKEDTISSTETHHFIYWNNIIK